MEKTLRSDRQQEWLDELLPDEEDVFKEKSHLYEARGRDVWEVVKEILRMANVVRVSIWHKEKNLASIPIVYGGLMTVIFPYLSVFSMISLLALDCKIIVEKK
ncbi:DUF4342 domain-containing protein [Ammoniphilus sp. CFH 90114]|uniref:DUF4342 domain-containing protein n=1 Tax=Ammoniphilus sp. CFH 90114 TaxID=2493665 RepID=UPI00100F3E9C|nr:DUF4342 domain-containing protein [Ammoniphilus sp. CFH 90114]RXT14843.1 DUF4342 domain-containing protein [Ammoniphilus sp. CFH 90114]